MPMHDGLDRYLPEPAFVKAVDPSWSALLDRGDVLAPF